MYDPQFLCTQKKQALLVIDMQNDFVSKDGAFAQAGFEVERLQRIEKTICRMVKTARLKNIPVIFIGMQHTDENDGNGAWAFRRKAMKHPNSCRQGTWGGKWYGMLQPLPSDKVIWKHRYSGFVNTSLHELLQQLGVETCVLTGINTNTCVESTARDAHHLDYHVVLVEDATACVMADAYEPSLLNIKRHFGAVVKSAEWLVYEANSS
ncbi:cysteine hydrolase family protein [Alkalihalobacterium alkalinitrilicum]|uniref:cysteine hydrolase family protein n=1 Tax=Alkalihalobacterium alkalinitrilicum TaxID=427920 RepID=UPI0009956EFD|nr:isochorismatase family cysteine hydrolase [Alkalihalobacterium alkalinitrilicum]